MTDREPGVMAALAAAGSINALARTLGIDPAAVSRWHRIPAARVIQVERVTGVRREILRPDLYIEAATGDAAE